MAKPTKIKNKNGSTSYRIFIQNNGKRESKTFSTRQLAQDWADKRQREVERAEVYGQVSTLTIRQIITDYQDRFGAGFGKSKTNDLARLSRYDIAELDISRLTPKHLVDHCVARNKQAKPQTVGMDLSTLKTALSTMSAVANFDFDQGVFDRASKVLKQERMIASTAKRSRLPTWTELLTLTRFFRGQQRSKTPMSEIMWFAYFSARRLSEITRLEWSDNNDDKKTGMVRDAKHPREKKGNHRRFKYEKTAWKIAQRQAVKSTYIFPYNAPSISVLFNLACKSVGIKDLHFHDLRHAAATRLALKGYSILEIQQFTLHTDWRVLSHYVNLKPEDILDK